MDLHGNWDGSLSYNPTQGMYSVTMNNFLHTNSEDITFMKSARFAFQTQLSARAPHQELSTNLLDWMSYSYFVDDGSYAHRFRAVGDPKQVYDRQSYIGSLGNGVSDCTLAGNLSLFHHLLLLFFVVHLPVLLTSTTLLTHPLSPPTLPTLPTVMTFLHYLFCR